MKITDLFIHVYMNDFAYFPTYKYLLYFPVKRSIAKDMADHNRLFSLFGALKEHIRFFLIYREWFF